MELVPSRQLRGTQFDTDVFSFDAIAPLTGSTTKQAVGATHAETAAITAVVIRVVSTTNCYLQFGASPVADNSKLYLPANFPEYFQFNTGDKISVIRDTADGNLFITPAA